MTASRLETNKEVMETLIASARAIPSNLLAVVPPVEEVIETPPANQPVILYEESHHFTSLILLWPLRPKLSMLAQVFVDELTRRKGLRAYGIRLFNRKSALASNRARVSALVPRLLSAPQASSPESNDDLDAEIASLLSDAALANTEAA